jgi:hypothetical protein
VKKVLYKGSSEIYIIKRKMIGIRTVLKTLALICLVNLTFIRAEEATATVENKVDTPTEFLQTAPAEGAEGNLRGLIGCLAKGMTCFSSSVCCSKQCLNNQTCY